MNQLQNAAQLNGNNVQPSASRHQCGAGEAGLCGRCRKKRSWSTGGGGEKEKKKADTNAFFTRRSEKKESQSRAVGAIKE